MSIDANKKLLTSAVANFSAATLDAYLQFYHPDATLHFLPPGMPQGREGARLFYGAFLAAFPDARLTIDDMLVEGDRIAARFTLEATHRGEFLGMLPSGQRVSINGLTIFRFEDGHCMERWSETNLLGVLQPGPA